MGITPSAFTTETSIFNIKPIRKNGFDRIIIPKNTWVYKGFNPQHEIIIQSTNDNMPPIKSIEWIEPKDYISMITQTTSGIPPQYFGSLYIGLQYAKRYSKESKKDSYVMAFKTSRQLEFILFNTHTIKKYKKFRNRKLNKLLDKSFPVSKNKLYRDSTYTNDRLLSKYLCQLDPDIDGFISKPIKINYLRDSDFHPEIFICNPQISLDTKYYQLHKVKYN